MYLTDAQRNQLAARARTEGVSEAKVIRRVLDEALGLSASDADRLEAVAATAGLLAEVDPQAKLMRFEPHDPEHAGCLVEVAGGSWPRPDASEPGSASRRS